MSTHYTPDPADLRRLRESCDFSQAKLARALGWERTDVVAVESGRRRLGLVRLQRWAAACGHAVRLVPADGA
ncbi:MAG: helix-turn-helix transcriptional regulator [Planctomycetota bacterium]|jgi:transcriptional regulator with XRE-family HTH domain